MRRSRSLRLALALAGLAATLFAGSRRVGPLPPLGPFLDPWSGVWASAAAEPRDSEQLELAVLEAPVRIVYDDRGVPHIFAASAVDAARALGFVAARDRLFQMELRWRAPAGRLSELLGAEALDVDRAMRRLGLAWSAERDWAALDDVSPAAVEMRAYAEGVNARVANLGRRDLPLEYHLLSARPGRWEPVHVLYMLKLMGWDLTYPVTMDLRRLRLQARVGREAARALLPVNSPIQQPVQPNGQAGPRYDVVELPPPGAPDPAAERLASELQLALGGLFPSQPAHPGEPPLGSNNWAVAPQRTAAGHALLAGDPHLELTLPSTWYEAHLSVAGELDVYGVTVPNVPFIVLGFNREVAWSFTNTGADVIDYYQEELDDTTRPSSYKLDGAWRPLGRRIEEYRGRGGRLLTTDTLYFTHRGPLLQREGRALSMRWTVLEGGGAALALREAARASSVQEWLRATEVFTAPAQNMVVADRSGTIAIRSTGHFPLQPDGDGLELRDGRSSLSDWVGYWPIDRYPFAIEPPQGYLASANQQPIDPRVDSTYLGADWPSPWRALRINELLQSDSSVTAEAMRRFQTDPGNARANLFVPFFLAAVAYRSAKSGVDPEEETAARLLSEWDRRYTRDNDRAVLFEYAMDAVADRLWDELQVDPSSARGGRRVFTPSDAVLASLLQQPQSVWWDDLNTPETVEERDAILAASLVAGFDRARRAHGPPDSEGWRWERIRHINIHHLLQIPALSRLELPVQGGPGNLNPASGQGTHGASWRMVVEAGPEMRAWTVYPGGQSGDPLSSRYADRVDSWLSGELEPVVFPRVPEEIESARVTSVLDLVPGG